MFGKKMSRFTNLQVVEAKAKFHPIAINTAEFLQIETIKHFNRLEALWMPKELKAEINNLC